MSLNGIQFLLADPAPVNQTANRSDLNGPLHMLVLMGGMLLVFWFLVIQPQRKRDKALKAMLAALRPGDKIVTSSGIVGVVLSLKDKTVSIRSNDAKLEVLKSAIGEVTERGGGGGNEGAAS
jgi:preprotein translocase subunit YajC